MAKNNRSFRARQLATLVTLSLVVVGCVGGGLYLRNRSVPQATGAKLDATADINAALERLQGQSADEVAQVYSAAPESTAQKAEIVFEGVADADTMRNLTALLKEHEISTTFFFSGAQAQNSIDALSVVNEAGYAIGAMGATGDVDWNALSRREIVTQLCTANLQLALAAGVHPVSLLTKGDQPTQDLLACAYACDISRVVRPTAYVSAQSFASAQDAQKFVERLNRGSIVCVRLASARPQLMSVAGWLLDALSESDLTRSAREKLESAGGEKAQALNRVYTTEEAVAFTYSGLGNDKELSHLLLTLDTIGGQAVFFVSAEEMESQSAQIKNILSHGHDLGVAVRQEQGATAETVLEGLIAAQEKLKIDFGYENATLVRPVYGTAGDALLLAAKAGGFTVLSEMTTAVRSGDARATDAQTLLDALFTEGVPMLQRGQIVHFQMKLFTQSDTLLSQLTTLIAQSKSLYPVRSAAQMLKSELCYVYPVPRQLILPQVRDRIYPGQLTGSALQAIQARYIGADWITTTAMLPGFTKQEIATLDKKGYVQNEQDMVFLTFDDWGTDEAITPILRALAAHGAKATFFVRTQNVVYNPNLLRAIALEGHTIACHTNTHFVLANDANGKATSFSSLTPEQVTALQKDLVDAYDILQSTVGDVAVDGKPALSLLFRPPTLAVSKEGLEAVFDCGFTYSVSGNYSSQDYKAKSAEALASGLKRNTKSGSVLVMHMSDNSVYTAQGLELYLSQMELNTRTRYRFCGLSDALATAAE